MEGLKSFPEQGLHTSLLVTIIGVELTIFYGHKRHWNAGNCTVEPNNTIYKIRTVNKITRNRTINKITRNLIFNSSDYTYGEIYGRKNGDF